MIKLVLFIFFLFNHIDNYIVLPIKTLSKQNYFPFNESDSLKNEIFEEYYSSLYTELDIGTKTQKIPLLIEVKTNDFLITSNHSIENASDYYLNKIIYDYSQNFLKNYDYFNENKSSSISCEYCENRKKYKKETPIDEVSCPAKDIFYFYENINMKKKEKEEKFYLELARNIKDNITWIIGLGLYDAYFRRQSSFLYILNQNNIINNYSWFFEMDLNNDKKDGKIIIGVLLDEIYNDKYDRNDLVYANANQGYSYWKINFDKIYINISNYEYDLDEAFCELAYDTNIIVANAKYKKYFELNLNDLLKQNKCFTENFEGQNSFYNDKSNFIFYYCKNEKDIKEKLYDIILPINFYSSEFNFTFEINKDDILKETGQYIYFKILFGVKNLNYWILGKIFSLKYKFIFNPELKKVGFYTKFKDIIPSDDNTSKEKDKVLSSTVIKILIIIPICILINVVGVLIGKKIYGERKKKRANEMNDEYEYLTDDARQTKNETGNNQNNVN